MVSADIAGMIVIQVIPRFIITQHIRIHKKDTEIPCDELKRGTYRGYFYG